MTTTLLSRADEARVAHLRSRLRNELAAAELVGLDERARTLRSELAAAEARLSDSRRARIDADVRRLRADREARERHAEMLRERAEDGRRRREAREWLARATARGPQPLDELQARAASDGINPDAVAVVGVRVWRRGDPSRRVHVSAAEPLRRVWLPLEH